MPRADAIHLGLMVTALLLAYVLPFELLLLSYAVLGPVHYLTEISWLHERRYFMPWRVLAWLLAILALAAVNVTTWQSSGLLIWSGLLVAALAAIRMRWGVRALLAVVAATLTWAIFTQDLFIAVTAALLPTLIHVSLFTLIFMIVGAHRARSASQAALIGVYLGSIALILALPPSAPVRWLALDQSGWPYFASVAPALGKLVGMPGWQLDYRFAGLLSFVYTYHYLNWFIKVDVIRWRDVPAWRLAGVTMLGLAATVLYFYDYDLGFRVLLFLSLLHVMLEFPLNALSVRQLAGIVVEGAQRRGRLQES
jgi:hypothetical protein